MIKKNGIIAVIHRATWGDRYKDILYNNRRIDAEKKGLLWGAYHLGTYNDGVIQANHFLNTIGNTSNILLVLDIEPSRTTKKLITLKQVEDFIKTVHHRARNIMIYGSLDILKKFNSQLVVNHPLWIALYRPHVRVPIGWNKWNLWQYTDGKSGMLPHSVIGVGLCDRNKFNGSVDKLKSFWSNNSLHL